MSACDSAEAQTHARVGANRTKWHQGARLFVAIVVAASAAGCGVFTPALESIDSAGSRVCSSQDAEGRTAFAVSPIVNSSGGLVRVEKLELLGARDVLLLGGRLTDYEDPDASFVGYIFLDRVPASFTSTELAPGTAVIVGVALQAEKSGGSADGVRLTYVGRNGAQTVDTRIAMEVPAAGEACSMSD